MSWPKVKLGDICRIEIGKTPPRAKSEYWGIGYPFLSIKDMNQGKFMVETKEEITDAALQQSNYRLVPKGTLLMSFKLSIGKLGITKVDMYTNEAIAALYVDESRVYKEYLYHALQSIDLLATTDRAVMGATLNKRKLALIPVPLPPLDEQRRIASILNKADEIKNDTKKAIDTRPKVLYSLFFEMFGDLVSIDKGWEKCALGAHIKIKHGYAFKSQFFTKEGDYVLLTPGNFWEEGGYKDRGEKQPYYTGEIPDDYILSKNDLLVAMTEQAPGLLGSAIIISEDNRFLHNQRLGLVTYDEDKLDLNFLYFLFNSPRIRELIQIRSTGTKVKHTSPTKMEEIEVFLPPIELQKEFAKYYRLENNNSDYDVVRVEELVNSISQEMIT